MTSLLGYVLLLRRVYEPAIKTGREGLMRPPTTVAHLLSTERERGCAYLYIYLTQPLTGYGSREDGNKRTLICSKEVKRDVLT